ncbi:SWIM-domain containing Srs2 interacting protein 1 family protein [Acanthamoeba castellanii str. Neff]|uniref:SWIM-domain containing Srs2 interacting protein 1 family protein n=1 Tax=Acanthamoeba castellanii (strain ATCC 30010 / Neff) TaxID=1257118 RepID=L8GTB1_ACACF|nr:SWIM-domain containing Srs2 interacting protein 1 family protein [Acanthamoeba castellanii str. Neff]ELR16240.1 SWIM-domain containing Srs2 interacting protein 1 family protein [Acanthamoeba castellanii str. Neff]
MASTADPGSLEAVAEELFLKVKTAGRCTLYFVFDAVLFAALDIIDRNRVVQVVATPSGRSYYQLAGQGKKSGKWSTKYICFGHYCSCPAFTYSVLKGDPRETPFMCKHQLAVRLAPLVGKCRRKERRLFFPSLSLKTTLMYIVCSTGHQPTSHIGTGLGEGTERHVFGTEAGVGQRPIALLGHLEVHGALVEVGAEGSVTPADFLSEIEMAPLAGLAAGS